MRVAILLGLWLAGAAAADPIAEIEAAARGWSERLPRVERVDAIKGRCGAAREPTEGIAYCTGANVIYATPAARTDPDAAYLTAHLYGHAMQVQFGVADVALRTIRANRDREGELRADVERMVECLAGHLAAAAGHPAGPTGPDEPLDEPHWGANLARGPVVILGLAERQAWFARGAQRGLDACDTESFPADLVREALAGR